MNNRVPYLRGVSFVEVMISIAIIGIIASIILVVVREAVVRAQEISYTSTVHSLITLTEIAALEDGFQGVGNTSGWACLGMYDKSEKPCWGPYGNDAVMDDVLSGFGELTRGVHSPYPSGELSPHGFAGAVVKKESNLVQIKVYAGLGRAESMCPKMGMDEFTVEAGSICVMDIEIS